MTVKHLQGMHRPKYECDQCKKVDFWGDGWSWYGSYLLLDSFPNDVPTLCSDDCADKFRKRLKSGNVKIPELSNRGWTVHIKSERHGY